MLLEAKSFQTAAPIDAPGGRSNRSRIRRGAADHLRDAIMAMYGDHAIVASHSEKAWASITFEGSRHMIKLLFKGPAAIAAGEDLIANLPEHEFDVPGQIVASADVTAVDHCLLPEPSMALTAQILLLKDL